MDLSRGKYTHTSTHTHVHTLLLYCIQFQRVHRTPEALLSHFHLRTPTFVSEHSACSKKKMWSFGSLLKVPALSTTYSSQPKFQLLPSLPVHWPPRVSAHASFPCLTHTASPLGACLNPVLPEAAQGSLSLRKLYWPLTPIPNFHSELHSPSWSLSFLYFYLP